MTFRVNRRLNLATFGNIKMASAGLGAPRPLYFVGFLGLG